MDQYLKDLWSKAVDGLKALWAKLNSDLSTLWANDKLFVIVFCAIIIIIKFRELWINFLISNAKYIFNKATKQSDVLQKQENQDNQKADMLQKDAATLENEKDNVNDSWYKKE